MNKLEPKVIYICTLKGAEELVTCPGYRWQNYPDKCLWKSISDECLNKRINKNC